MHNDLTPDVPLPPEREGVFRMLRKVRGPRATIYLFSIDVQMHGNTVRACVCKYGKIIPDQKPK